MQAVLDGHNKKRRMTAGNATEDMDEYERRKLERVREREQMMAEEKDFNEDEVAQHLLEGGAIRARKAIELKKLAEEEELSEDELRQQVDHSRFHKFMQERRRQDTQKSLEDHSK